MAQVAAWVVAVERHAQKDGQASPLDVVSPISTPALDFALLSLQRDPQAKLFINVSHPGRAEDLAALQTLKQAGATIGDASLGALRSVLAKLAAAGADILLLYWVGHGVMQESRQLVTADSHSPDDGLTAVDVDGLLAHLRSEQQAVLQVGFFECCAQVVSATPDLLKLARHKAADRLQYYYFAASAGEVASADTRAAGFTQSALSALRTVPWPPEPGALRSAFSAALEGVPLQTRPAMLQWTDGSGDLWSQDGSNAVDLRQLTTWSRAAGVSVSEFSHLIADAGQLIDAPALAQAIGTGMLSEFLPALAAAHPDAAGSIHVELLRRAVIRWSVMREIHGPAINLALYWGEWRHLAIDELRRERRHLAIDELRRQGRRGPDASDLPGMLLELLDQTDLVRGFDSLIRVLEGASRRARPLPAKALRDVMSASASLGPRIAAAVAEMPPPQSPLYLAAAVALPVGGVAVHVDAAWLLDGLRREPLVVPSAEDGLAVQLNQLADTVVSRDMNRPLVIELLVPSDLLCIPRRLLEFGNELLGVTMWLECQWPIVLRWRDRLDLKTGPRRFNSARWKQQAQAAEAARGPNAPLALRFADTANPGVPAELVALTFPGPSPAEPQRNRMAFFQALLSASHPYMCWPRDPVASDAKFRARVAELVQGNPFDGLAGALVIEKHGPDQTLHDLLLLIDEPKRNPFDGRLDEPAVAPAP